MIEPTGAFGQIEHLLLEGPGRIVPGVLVRIQQFGGLAVGDGRIVGEQRREICFRIEYAVDDQPPLAVEMIDLFLG